MPLTSAERRSLRARAHTLKPVVQTGGQGLTEAVLAEVDIALEAHELIKLRLPGMPREDRRAAARRSAARSSRRPRPLPRHGARLRCSLPPIAGFTLR